MIRNKDYLNSNLLEIAKEYLYLGMKFKPSGSMDLAVNELCSKSNREWFSISSMIYKDKRVQLDKAFQLFSHSSCTLCMRVLALLYFAKNMFL